MRNKAVSILAPILMTFCIAFTSTTAFSAADALPEGQLTGQIDYYFVGHFGQFDDQGRLLVWEGTIEGDFTGVVKWWFEIPGPALGATYDGGRFAFYAARWEIWADGKLILAGASSGKTVFADGADGIWDGHGVVTEGSGPYNVLKGRKLSETGTVLIGDMPPVTYTGRGLFSIY